MAGLVCLDASNADLTVRLDDAGTRATVCTEGSLPLLWGGVRGNTGATGGKYYFKIKLEKIAKEVPWPPLPEEGPLGSEWASPQHSARIGVSHRSTKLSLLGEDKGSWAYDSSGKALEEGKVSEYGQPYEDQDEICCFIDWGDDGTVLVSFSKNGELLLDIFSLQQVEEPLFPHIALQGMGATVSFQEDTVMGHQCWQAALCKKGHYFIPPALAKNPAKCSATFVIGLSGAGKTEWCLKQAAEHPDKNYQIVGIDRLLEQLHLHKVSTVDRESLQFAAIMKLSNELISRLFQLAAAASHHNYLLDHYTLAFKGARIKKAGAFPAEKFTRKAAVIILDEAEYVRKAEGAAKWGPASSGTENLMNMKVGFSYPLPEEDYDEVLFVDQRPPKADKILEKLKKEAQLYFSDRKRRSQVLASGLETSGKQPEGAAKPKKPRVTSTPAAKRRTETPTKKAVQPTKTVTTTGGPASTKSLLPKPAGTKKAATAAASAASRPAGGRRNNAGAGRGRGRATPGSQLGRRQALPPPVAMPRPRLGPQPYNPAVLPEHHTAVRPGMQASVQPTRVAQQQHAQMPVSQSITSRALQPGAPSHLGGLPLLGNGAPVQQPNLVPHGYHVPQPQQQQELLAGLRPPGGALAEQGGWQNQSADSSLANPYQQQHELDLLTSQRAAQFGLPGIASSQMGVAQLRHGGIPEPEPLGQSGREFVTQQDMFQTSPHQHSQLLPESKQHPSHNHGGRMNLQMGVQQPGNEFQVNAHNHGGWMLNVDQRQRLDDQQYALQSSIQMQRENLQMHSGNGFGANPAGAQPPYPQQDGHQAGIPTSAGPWSGQPLSHNNAWERSAMHPAQQFKQEPFSGQQGMQSAARGPEEPNLRGKTDRWFDPNSAFPATSDRPQPSLQPLGAANRPPLQPAAAQSHVRPGALLEVFDDSALRNGGRRGAVPQSLAVEDVRPGSWSSAHQMSGAHPLPRGNLQGPQLDGGPPGFQEPVQAYRSGLTGSTNLPPYAEGFQWGGYPGATPEQLQQQPGPHYQPPMEWQALPYGSEQQRAPYSGSQPQEPLPSRVQGYRPVQSDWQHGF